MNEQPLLSIVIPAYNEERRLPATLARLFEPAAGLCRPFEIIVVDDGSTDGTRHVVLEAMQTHPELRLIENPHSGKAYTVRTGALEARGTYTVHADADLSTPPQEFTRLINALQAGYDVAIGSRSGRPGAPWYRLIMSTAWRLLVSVFVIRGFRDTQCGFKAYRTGAAQRVFQHTLLYNTPAKSLGNPSVTAASDVEVLFIACRLGYRIAEVPIQWTHAEDTKIRPVGDSVRAFLDLIKIRWYAQRGLYGERRRAA
jgi:dolichyl-phosphate beta-glucosyltransferase